MNWLVHASAMLLVVVTGATLCAQPGVNTISEPATLRGDSSQTRKRLTEAEQKLLAGKHAEATDDLQRILDESGDDFISFDGKSYRPARWIIHQLLAKLPQDALKAYQDRIDQPAKKLLERAKQTRDPRVLSQLLARYFVSRPSAEALLLLGDLSFERGEFRAAEIQWRRLLPDANADIVYPDSKLDVALIRARIILALHFAGETATAKSEFAGFKNLHATATGTIAGRTGPIVDTLDKFLAAQPEFPTEPGTAREWLSYGNNPARTGRLGIDIPRAWPASPSWSANLPQVDDTGNNGLPPAKPPYGHPIVVDGTLFVADSGRVFGYALQTGELTHRYAPLLTVGTNAQSCASLTASGGLLFARFGSSIVRAPEKDKNGKREESLLLCLKPKKDPKDGGDGALSMRELWRVLPPEDAKTQAVWEGAPLVVGNRMWALYAKFEAGRVIHVAVCYDAIGGDADPAKPLWTAELCDSPQPVSAEGRTRQDLLTLAGQNLVFCSNSGAVISLDSATGQRQWGFRYSRTKRNTLTTSDPAPAVAVNGRILIAPTDADRVYALDASSGQPLWESGTTEGARILGIAGSRVIVTTVGPVRGIRALDLATGSHRDTDGGWVLHNGTGLLSYGHGFVAENVVIWPSREGLVFLNPANGRVLGNWNGNPTKGPFPNVLDKYFGHVVCADGVLVVVSSGQIWAYRSQANAIPRPDATPREKFDWLAERAEREYARGERTTALATYSSIATGEFPPELRAWAVARMLQLSPRVSTRDRLPQAVQDAIRPAILNEWILSPDGIPVTLQTFLSQHLGTPANAVRAGEPPASALPAQAKLTPDSDFVKTHRFPAAVTPLTRIPGASCEQKRIYAASLNAVFAVPLDQSAVSEYHAQDVYTHAADLRDGFVAVGPAIVAVYGEGREPVWVFRFPHTPRLPTGRAELQFTNDNAMSLPELSSFLLNGNRLFARFGESHLVAVDLQAKQVLWVRSATGHAGFEQTLPVTMRFWPQFAVCGELLLAQLSDGRRVFVALNSGRFVPQPALGDRTAKAAWSQPPQVLGDHHALIADDAGLVRLAKVGSRVKWVYEVEHTDGLAGEPAQTRVWNDTLIIAVRRNHGVELERVDLADGKSCWGTPFFVDADRVQLANADAHADSVGLAANNRLFVLNADSGKMEWQATLPNAGARNEWIVRMNRDCVIVYPTRAIAKTAFAELLSRVSRSFRTQPDWLRLPGLAQTLYDAWVDCELPVLLFDRESGKRIGGFTIPARGPSVVACWCADTVVFATGDRVVWIK